jgi:hypothetical protein
VPLFASECEKGITYKDRTTGVAAQAGESSHPDKKFQGCHRLNNPQEQQLPAYAFNVLSARSGVAGTIFRISI